MNHFRAILDVPAEWRLYREKYAEYIAAKLDGRDVSKPNRHPLPWTIAAMGLAIGYGAGACGIVYSIWQYHPLSTLIVSSLVLIFWFIFGIACISDKESRAEIIRKEERRRR